MTLAFAPMVSACPVWDPWCWCTSPDEPGCGAPPQPPQLGALKIEYVNAEKTAAFVFGSILNWRPGANTRWALYATRSCPAGQGTAVGRLLGYTDMDPSYPGMFVLGGVSGLQPGEFVTGGYDCATVITPTRVYFAQPSSASSGGGTRIVLTGVGFKPSTIVKFDGVEVEKTLISESQIEVVAPRHPEGATWLSVYDPVDNQLRGATYAPFHFVCPHPPPQIVSSSPDVTITRGDSVTLQVQATGEALGYAWSADDGSGFRSIANATASSLKVSPEQSTIYRVQVRNDCDVKSRSMQVNVVGPPPLIRTFTPDGGPLAGGTRVTIGGMNFTSGTTVTFGGVAAQSVRYWTSRLLEAVSPPHVAGAVSVVVRNPDGPEAAKRFTYEACVRPRIAHAPQDLSLWRGATASLSVEAFGQAPLAYQWFIERDGAYVKLDGATTPDLPVTAGQSTSYQVVVKNACGSKASAARVFVCDMGQIAVDGTTLTLIPDGPVLAIQWLQGGEPIEGATELQLAVTEEATYTAQVTTPCGVYEVSVDVTPSG